MCQQQDERLIAIAEKLCSQAHFGQIDKGGKDYVEHPRRVATYVHPGDTHAYAAALLHDVLEDSPLTPADLAAAGIPAEVIEIVQLLTRSPEISSDEYYGRIRTHPGAREVKLADLADNTDPARLAELGPADQERLSRKYVSAYAHLGADPADGDRRRGSRADGMLGARDGHVNPRGPIAEGSQG
jgi:(p)ppGpp synthase/HD superfamily hydrolase